MTAAAHRRLLAHLAAALAFLLLSAFYLRPLHRVFATHLAPDPGDPVFNLYLLKWGLRCAAHGLEGYWSPPFFFPAHDALAYSDHLLGPVVLAVALSPLLPGALAAYNLFFYLSFALSGWGTWWVLRRAGVGPWGAFLGGCVFAFSAFRWDQLSHLQVLLTWWVPFTLWSCDRLLAAPSWRRAAVFFCFYLLHASGGAYLAYMIHVPLAALVATRLPSLWATRRASGWRSWAPLFAAGLAALVLTATLYSPYLRRREYVAKGRGESSMRIWGATLPSYLTPSDSNLYRELVPARLRRPENRLFPGFVATALLAGGLTHWARRRRAEPARGSPARRAVAAACLGLALAGLLLGDLHSFAATEGLEVLDALVPRASYTVPAVLFGAGLLGWLLARRPWRRSAAGPPEDRLDPWWRGLLWGGALTLLLSLPVVYAKAREVVPGLDAMRVPARFHAFTSFAVAACAGLVFDRWLAARSPRRRAWIGAAVSVFLLGADLRPLPLDWTRPPGDGERLPAASWLAQAPDVEAVLELPLRGPLQEIAYMHAGTRHWRPLVNGYSGFSPPHYALLREQCCEPVPNAEALTLLRSWGVSHLVVHLSMLDGRERQALRRWQREAAVPVVFAGRHDRVYDIRLRRRTSPAGRRGRGEGP